jgi:hypothetical protein
MIEEIEPHRDYNKFIIGFLCCRRTFLLRFGDPVDLKLL